MHDLNDMMYFTEVVNQGGFAAAARVLGLPKSRLSRRVARLEADLGVRLLQRTTRKLSLTSPGEVFFRHCLAVRDEAEAAAAAVASIQAQPRGVIRVSCPVTLAQTVLGPILPRFLKAYPSVQVHLQVTNRVVDVIDEGVDVALRVRTALEDSATLIVKHLGLSQTVLVASPAFLKKTGRHIAHPSDLDGADLVAMSVNDGKMFWQLFGPGDQHYTVTQKPCFVADDLQTLKYAVLQGVGFGVLPDYMCANELAQGELVQVTPEWRPRPGMVHALFGSRRGLMPAVRVFLDFLGEQMSTAFKAP
jgi:DNA-binding transcriptional LysR family regulator